MRLFAVVFAVALAAPLVSAQALWTDVSEASLRPAAGARVTVPTAYRVVRLDVPQMAARLGAAPAEARTGAASGAEMRIPLPDGSFATVRVVESSVMAPELQAKYPEIRTYLAQGAGSVSGRLSQTPAGFRGMLFTPQGTVFLDPYARGDAGNLIVYYGSDLDVDPTLRGRLADEVEGESAPAPRRGADASRANGTTRRTYRLAMAATGEYTAFHGGTVAAGLGAITTTVNRVTAIYERDLSVRFQLVANNNLIVYTDASTDPYANTSGDLNANQANINNVIGSANYDVGHLVGTGGGGVAGLGVICSGSKARGLTGSSAPVGDAFDVDYVAHEMGHQFGGNHTFNGNAGACASPNRNGPTAFEPGSGSTIQAYAGICGGQNIQNNSDAYFHAGSLDEMTAHITVGSGSLCGTTNATGNGIPAVTVPAAFTIPVGTPFALTGSATDDTPGSLTYAWEEMDAGTVAGAAGSTTPPFFRSFLPTASPTRVFPKLARLVAGQAPLVGETLPTTSQTLNFRLTARDNRAGGGAINDATTTVTTDASAGPFVVTFANTANQSFGGTATVTWNVAGTNGGAVNTPTVDILYSTDNGATFTTVLAANTPNDGSEAISFPTTTTQGRIQVRAVGNVFFNVNSQRFTVTSTLPSPTASVTPASVSTALAPDATQTRTVTLANTAAPGSANLAFGASVQNLTTAPTRPAEALVQADARRDALAARLAAFRPEAPLAKGDRSRAGTGTAPVRRAGGPDTFGYVYADSDESGGPAASFQNISGTGTAVTWTAISGYPGDDEGYADIALPFTFPYYGADQTSVRVYANGFLTFSSFVGESFQTQALPSAATPNGVIAPLWDDLDLSGGAATTGTLPDGRFVVQYSSASQFGVGGSDLTFQAILSANGTIEFQYATMTTSSPNSVTIGIENAAGTDGLQVVRNAAYITSNRAVRFSLPLAPWLSVAPAGGSITPGASAPVTLSFDAEGLAEGTYTADVVVSTNDPVNATLTVPVTLTVSQTGIVAGVEGWRMLAPAASGMTVDDLAAINLVQGVPGFYPSFGANLYTGYDGTSYTTSGTGAVLTSGQGFFWRFYDVDFAPGGPSDSRALPTTLTTTRTAVTTDTPVAIQAAGSRFNLLGNPFDTGLDISNIGAWTGGGPSTIASTVAQVWDANAGTYDSSLILPTIAPWQGFWLEAADGATGTLTIPASARTTGGTLQRGAPRSLVAFELAQADGPLRDRSAILVLSDDANEGRDALDASKLSPLSEAHVLLAFGEGEALRSVESRPVAPVTLPIAVASVGAGADLVLTWPRLDALPDGWTATLHDLTTGTVVDLSESDRYAFAVAPTAARGTEALPVSMRASAMTSRFSLTVGPRGTVANEDGAAAEFALDVPRPNPARTRSEVGFSLTETGTARLSIVDLLGREVVVLADGERAAGRHTEALDASRLAPGVYVVRLTANGQALAQRLVVVR